MKYRKQISLASKEASGTGKHEVYVERSSNTRNRRRCKRKRSISLSEMRISIIFGESSDQVIEHYAKSDYGQQITISMMQISASG